MGSRARTASLRLCLILSKVHSGELLPITSLMSKIEDAKLASSEANEKDSKVYELSYLISSLVPQEKVEGETEKITGYLSKIKASTIASEKPELLDLAYEVTQKRGGKNDRFSQAYFGWVKFEAMPDTMDSLKKSLSDNDMIIRYLLINTIKENTYLGKRAPTAQALEKEMIKDEASELSVSLGEVEPVEAVESEIAPDKKVA